MIKPRGLLLKNKMHSSTILKTVILTFTAINTTKCVTIPDDSHETLPIIMPLVYTPQFYATRVFVTYGESTSRFPTQHAALLDASCETDDGSFGFVDDRSDKVIWGGLGFRRRSGNRPDGVTSITGQALEYYTRIDHSAIRFCIRSPWNQETYFGKLMEKFTKKVVSFWADTSLHFYDTEPHEYLITGEMVVGGVNPKRFVAGSTKSFELRPIHASEDVSKRWVSKNSVQLRIGDEVYPHPINVGIWLGESESLVAPLIYDRIFSEVHFADEDIFPCFQASRVKPLVVGNLEIPAKMLYVFDKNGWCTVTIKKFILDDTFLFEMGIDLLRQFHLAISFDHNGSSFAHVSTRVDDPKAVKRPAQTVSRLKSSQSVESYIKKHPKVTKYDDLESPPLIRVGSM